MILGTCVWANRKWNVTDRKGRYLIIEKFWQCRISRFSLSEKENQSRASQTF